MAVQIESYDVDVRKLTFDEVLQMVEAGILEENERVELVDGVLVRLSPEGMNHGDVITWLTRRLTTVYTVPIEVRVNTTRPLSGPHNYRLPDALVVHPADDRWADPEEVILAVEVAKTSIRTDLGRKARDYAPLGYRRVLGRRPQYWDARRARRSGG